MNRGAKGANCTTTREVIRETVGPPVYDSFVATLPHDLRLLATRKILAIEWIDYDSWMALEQRFYDGLFGGDCERYRAVAGLVVERDFNTLYRVFIKVGSPAFLLERAAQAYSKFSTVGTMSCVKMVKAPTRAEPAILRLEGVPNLPVIICGMLGSFEALLALTRAKNPAVWIVSQSGPPDACVVDFGLTY